MVGHKQYGPVLFVIGSVELDGMKMLFYDKRNIPIEEPGDEEVFLWLYHTVQDREI